MAAGQAVSGRIQSIDFLRLVAAFSVVFIHSHVGENMRQLGYFIFDQAAGFAVPFFFIVSGYFFTQNVREAEFPGRIYRRYALRLTMLFVVWSLINGAAIYIVNRHFDPWAQLGPNMTSHLWFFPALLIGLSLLFLFLKYDFCSGYIYFAVILYILGLLAGAYALTPVGFYTDFNTRNGPFFASLFVGIGMLIALKDYRPSLRIAVLVLLALALRDRFRINHVTSYLSSAAKLTLGLYAIQGVAITYLVKTEFPLGNSYRPFIYPVAVFTLSLYLAFIISKIPGLRRIVS